MKPLDADIEGAQVRAAEALLRQAADFEPDTPAPANLVHRALAAAQEREAEWERAARPHRKVALFSSLFAGTGAAWATIALAINMGQPAGVPRGALKSHKTVARVEQSELPVERPRATGRTLKTGGDREAVVVASSGRSGRKLRALQRRPQAPSKHWTVETVTQTVALVTADGWVVERDEETGALVATPGVADLVVQADALQEMMTSGEITPAPAPVETPSAPGEPTNTVDPNQE